MTELETQILQAVADLPGDWVPVWSVHDCVNSSLPIQRVHNVTSSLAGKGYLFEQFCYFSLTDKGRAALQGERNV